MLAQRDGGAIAATDLLVLALFAVGDVYVSLCKKSAYTPLACGEGRERYFGCNLMQRKVLASSYQHLMAEAPRRTTSRETPSAIRGGSPVAPGRPRPASLKLHSSPSSSSTTSLRSNRIPRNNRPTFQACGAGHLGMEK